MNTQTKEVISDALNSAPLTTSFKQKKSQCEVQTNMIGNLDNQTLLSIVEQVNDQRQKPSKSRGGKGQTMVARIELQGQMTSEMQETMIS